MSTRTLHPRPATRSTLPAAARIPYLPGLDGIRALAVIAVVLYHLRVAAVPGGFLGVDVFFVLSGFLITGSLVAEHARSGGVDLGRFLLRRARRLLPALWLMLLAVCTTAALAFRGELSELRTDVPAALLYVSNWASLAGEQSYFEAVGRPPLLQHLWSLAIEGQFYVVWPLVVVLLLRVGRPARGSRVALVARVALVGAALSTALMAALAITGGFPIPNDPSPAYLGSASHAMGLLLGAALGAVWAPWRTTTSRGSSAPWRLELVGAAGVIGLLAAFWWVDALSFALYRGGFAVVSVAAAMVVCAVAHPGSRVGRLLGTQPWRYLGQRSYGIYLWHWPVFMLTRPGFELAFDGVAAGVVRVGLTLLLAEASYRWVEVPVRSGAIGRWVTRFRVEPLGSGGRRSVRLVAGPVALGVLLVALTTVLAAPPVVAREPGRPVSVIVRPTVPDLEQAPPVAADDAPAPDVPTPPAVDPNAGRAVAPVEPAPAPAVPAAPAVPPATTFVGDSVMAAIAPALTSRFPALEVDAVTSRQPGGILDALAAISAAGRLGQIVVIGAGTNGAIAESQLRAMLELARPARRVIVLNDHVDRDWEGHNNELIGRVVPEYPNAMVFDWKSLASAHPEWLWKDGIHPRPAGADAIAAMFLAEAVSAAP
ncbi:MAG: acyltransferase family protein [Cellulomonas sp.]